MQISDLKNLPHFQRGQQLRQELLLMSQLGNDRFFFHYYLLFNSRGGYARHVKSPGGECKFWVKRWEIEK